MQQVTQSTQVVVPVRLLTTSGTAVTGIAANAVTVYVQKASGLPAAITPTSSTWAEPDGTNMPGVYDLTLSASATDTLGVLKYSVKSSTSDHYLGLLQVLAPSSINLSTIQSDLAAVQTSVAALVPDMAYTKNKADAIDSALSTVGSNAVDINNKIGVVGASTVAQRLTSLATDITTTKGDAASTKTLATAIDTRTTAIKTTVDSISIDSQSITDIKNAIGTVGASTVAQRLTTLQTDLTTTKTDAAAAKADSASTKTLATGIDTAVTTLDGKANTLLTNTTGLSTAVGDVDTKAATIITNTTGLQTSATSLQTSVTALQSDITTVKADVLFGKKVLSGRWKINQATNELYIYDSDGSTILKKFALKNALGVAASNEIYERVPTT